MTHPYDGSSIDLERELVRYLAERKVTRRELLQRIGAVGATAALAPVIAACTGSGASISPSAAAVRRQAHRHDGAVSRPTASAEPTPVPSPESDLLIYNYADYLDPTIVTDFEKKYGIKVDHHLLRLVRRHVSQGSRPATAAST